MAIFVWIKESLNYLNNKPIFLSQPVILARGYEPPKSVLKK